MARNLQPCGTWAAYKRHLRKGEDPCDDCREAARVQQRERSAARRAAREQSGLVLDSSAPVTGHPGALALAQEEEFEHLTLDPLTVAKQDLVCIEQFMTSAALLPSQFTGLSRRREELVDRIRVLSESTDDGGDALDELARRREDRIAAAAD